MISPPPLPFRLREVPACYFRQAVGRRASEKIKMFLRQNGILSGLLPEAAESSWAQTAYTTLFIRRLLSLSNEALNHGKSFAKQWFDRGEEDGGDLRRPRGSTGGSTNVKTSAGGEEKGLTTAEVKSMFCTAREKQSAVRPDLLAY